MVPFRPLSFLPRIGVSILRRVGDSLLSPPSVPSLTTRETIAMSEPRGFNIDREFEVECHGVGETLQACVEAGRDLVYKFIESENLDLEEITFIYGKSEVDYELTTMQTTIWRIHVEARVRAKIYLKPKLEGV